MINLHNYLYNPFGYIYSFTILFLWNVNDSQKKRVIGDGLFMILSISKKNLQKKII